MTGRAQHRLAGPLVSIQVLRGFAAVSVVFYHVYIMGLNYVKRPLFEAFSEPGKFGVNLFFVTSGFIICFAHRNDLDSPERLGRYLHRRVTRIYPVYWIFSAIYVAAALAGLGEPEFRTDILNVLSSIFLINLVEQVYPPLQVAWTLLYEMRFYLIFAVLLIHKRLGIALLGLWALYIAYSYITGHSDMWRLGTVWNVNFLLGCIVFLLRDRVGAPAGVALLAMSLPGIYYAAVTTNYALTPLQGHNDELLLLLGVCFSAVILGCIALEPQIARFSPPILRFFGDASYSIYLVHSAAISASYIILIKTGLVGLMDLRLWYFMIAAVAVACGCVAYFLVERPIMNMFRKRRTARLTATSPATA